MANNNIKKKKRKTRHLDGIAPLYNEDIGTEGIKKTGLTTASAATTAIGSIHKLTVTKEEKRLRRMRMERFGVVGDNQESVPASPLSRALSSSRGSRSDGIRKNQPGQQRLVGTSTALEKPYLRLTSFPKPENVRPLGILKKALAHIKAEFVKKEDFEWANEQLKSVRQDYTVQGIRTKDVLEVYETHARLLLEHGDLDEFHQCQTMIKNLTSGLVESEGQRSDKHGELDDEALLNLNAFAGNLKQSEEAADEFQAYSILFCVVQNSWPEVSRVLSSNGESSDAMSTSSSSEGERSTYHRGSARRHALHVMKAVVHNDYQAFFRLYESAPHLSGYLMDFLVRRVRDNAYERIIASYRPMVSVEHFRELLHFDDLEETRRFLKKMGAVFVRDQGGPAFCIDCKTTFQDFAKDSRK